MRFFPYSQIPFNTKGQNKQNSCEVIITSKSNKSSSNNYYPQLDKMSSFSQHKNSQSWRVTKSTITKNEIIQRYKQSERQKSILKNKLNILQEECQRNQRKAKSIESSFKKVNKIKQNYQKNKDQIQSMLRKNKEKQEHKIMQVKLRKEQNRGRLPMIMSWLEKQKSQEYFMTKKKSKLIDQKIRIFRNSIVSQRKKTAHKIKQQQKMVPFNRTLYIELKHKNARIHQQQQALAIQRKFKKSRVQLQQMKTLEDSLLQKLTKSRAKLNKSMSKLGKNIRG